ncbi:MAG: hypothetical protein JXO51_06920 [Candidatus Aminicenantes bacterium]|nr:hypothetical protein [Candidatus Aminicenantes bacterium]
MKKARIYLSLSLLAVAMAFGASLKVMQPNGGETLTLGQSYPITWTASGVSQKIKLVLAKGNGVPVGVIVENVAANASPFSWTVGQYQGGTASPGDYKIRVKVMKGPLEDLSDGTFTIQAGMTIPGPASELHMKTPGGVAAAMQSIQVTEPSTGSMWAEKGTFTIRWKTFLKKSPTIELYNYNGTKKVATITPKLLIMKFHENGEYKFDWTIPAGIYTFPGNYTIRVSADNGKSEGFSKMFHIDKAVNMVEKSANVEAQVNNQARRHYRFKCTSVDKLGIGFPAGPAAGIMRVGWENSWRQWGVGNYCHRHLCFVYRSFIIFDVSAFAKGRIIQKATLQIMKESTHYSDGNSVNNDHPGHCAAKLFRVLAPWSSAFDVQAELVGDGTAGTHDITSIVRDWALKGQNHGLMMTGRDESYRKNNEECISYYKAFLNIQFLENEG